MSPLEAALAVIKSNDDYAVARARAIMVVYHEQWGARWAGEYQVLEVEKEFAFPLMDPDKEVPSDSFDEGGKIDVLTLHLPTQRVKVVEHKTTSDDVAPASHYWDRLRLDTQISKYFLAALQDGHDIVSVVYDVVGKPGQRPCQVPLVDEHGFKIVLDQQGERVMTQNGKKPRETGDSEKGYILQTVPETPGEFEARLLKVMRTAPGDYFAQKEVPRLGSDLLDFMADDWQTAAELEYRREHNIWPRNPDACHSLGTCEMFELCCGRASVDGFRYHQRKDIHPELTIQAGGDGRQLLTTSRTKTLRKCARLHKLRYEDGVGRVGELSEALAFGTLMHKAWETYFLTLKNQ
jgi:hypothetical protein